MEVTWRVDVLGPLRLSVDGEDRPFPAGRPGRLLAALLLARGRVVSDAALVDAVWPDDPPADPRAALHTTVRRARHALGPASGRLVRRGHGYLLEREGLRLDAEDLTEAASAPDQDLGSLDRALGLWRGDPWAELAEDLATAEASYLRDCRRRLRENRARALARSGRSADAVGELVSLVGEDPLAEGPVALLVETLDAQGDVAGALAAYDDYRRRLADVLGLDPSPRLVELQRRVLRREQGPQRAPEAVASAPGRPSPPRTLFGREAQLRTVARLLDAGRCVTLVGPGGVGKTSLAARVAQDRDGEVWWVDLTRVAPGEEVLPAVAEAVGAMVTEGASLHTATLHALARRPGLLVLDNCEHVAPGVADLVDEVLRAAPEATLLATSRERLDVDGEQVLPLPPLQLPSRDRVDDTALRESPAVAMFLERAGAASPEAVTTEGLRVVADIVWRLDGLPLAIGLAAGRAGALTLTDLRDRLLEHLDELRTASRRAHPRQRTLAATIAWSFDLLTEEEQQVFLGLSVFASGFELDDVEVVLGRAAVPVVGDLVQRSLVSVGSDPAGTGRYVLLETLRAFAQDRLDGARRQEVESAHARWAADLARRIDVGLGSAEEARWDEVARRRLPDLAAAYHRSLEGADHSVARAVVYGLHRWGNYRVRPDVLAWASPLAEEDDPGVLAAASAHAWMLGETDRGIALASRALTIGRESGDLEPAGRAAEILGDLMVGKGDLERALEAYTEAQSLGESVDDAFDALTGLGGQLLALTWLGRPWEDLARRIEADRAGVQCPSARAMAAYCLGEAWSTTDPRRALAFMTEAVADAEAVGSRLVVGVARTAAAALATRTGPLDEVAAEQLATTLEAWLASGSESLLLTSLRNTVPALVVLGRHAEATELLAALQDRAGSWGEEASALDAARSAAREALGDGAFDRAWAAGAGRSLREAADRARLSLTS